MKNLSIGCRTAYFNFKLFYFLGINWKNNTSLTITLLILLLPAVSISQTIKLEQGQNGGVGRAVNNPVAWATGNSNDGNSHYVEGQSVPYRVTISNVAPGAHSLIIEWDLRRDGKSAIDYATGYQRIAETVNPLLGLSGNYGQPLSISVPIPQRNVSVSGRDGMQLQPLYSFNRLADNQRQIVLYNGTPIGISHSPEGNPAVANSSSRLKIDFTVSGSASKNVVLAWGGHISNRLDWGAPNAASDISGSPYHMRVISFDGKAGNQDRSLQNAAITFVPSCEILGNKTFCTDINYQYTAVTNAPTPHYEWTVTGGAVLSGQGTSTINVTWNSVNQGTVAVKIFDQSSTIPSESTNCSILLTKDIICPYYTPTPSGKVNTLIGSELTSLYLNFKAGSATSSNFIYTVSGDQVLIEVIATAGQYSSVLTLLKSPSYGLTNQIDNDNTRIITGFFPIANLPLLNNLPLVINYVRPAYPPIGNVGVTTTKGDISQHSDLARLGYDISGKKVKVGVLSDSYNKQPGNPALANVQNNDLPANVHVLKESPFGGIDEGRAMLQIVHDIAPNAKLAFRTGILSSGDLAKGIKELKQDTCDIIVDDLTYITEPFFQDGQVAGAVDLVTAQGVSYFTSAGNFGNKSYAGTFAPAPAPAGVTGVAHSFAIGDIFQKITVGPGTYTIVLQWEDPVYSLGQVQTGTVNDLDVYLTTDAGATLFGFNRNNLGGDPIEVLPFSVLEESSTNIMIVRAAGSTNVKLKYIVFRGDKIIFNEYNPGSSTIVGQANSKGAITVGAVLYSNTSAFGYKRPADSNPFTVASFSSIGGNLIQGDDRHKPDIVAPNGGNTTVTLGGLNVDYDLPTGTDGFYNFFGTSAAAPHAAGVAALLMEARSKYYNGVRYSPAEIRAVLKGSALNMHEPGIDVKSGAGFIQADASLLTIAAPKPSITALQFDTTLIPGKTPFIVTVEGQNLTPASKVLLRGVPLTTTYVSATQVQAAVGKFEGNPPVNVYTAAFSPSGLDGGSSDSLFFKGIVLKKIKVIADYKAKKYGEVLPAFTATVLVDEDTLTSSSELTLADLGLAHLEFATTANSSSNADKYIISVSTTISPLLKELYNYSFVDGLLTIEKMPLQITPNDLQVLYGEKFDDKITFSYAFDNSKIPSPQTFLNTLKLDHQTIFAANAIALVDSRAIANLGSRAIVNADLENLSFLASSRAIANSRPIVNTSRAIVNTTNVVDFDKQSIFGYLENPDTANLITPIINSRPIVNASRALVNSRAIVNARAIVNYSRAIVNYSRAIVNSRAIANIGAMVNSQTVGADSTTSNGDAVVIIDSLDIFNNDVPIIENGVELYELPALFSINMVTGMTAGTHFIVPGAFLTDLSNNFDVSYKTGNLKILKDTLTVVAPNTEIVFGTLQPNYNSSVSGYKYDDKGATVINSVDYLLKDAQGNSRPGTGLVAAGTYKIIPIVDLKKTQLQPGDLVNYFTKISYGTLTVKQAPLTVKVNDKVMLAGETPVYTSTYTGLLAGDTPTGLTYTTSPNYSGLAGVYSVTASDVKFAIPGNYAVEYLPGSLYVNPASNSAKAIRPILICVEEVRNNPSYNLKARFEYQNDNTTPIFIEIGVENQLVTATGYSGSQPVLFQPGGGSFDILFNGDKLTWTVVSYDKGKKTAVASTASSTSARCKKGSGGGREGTDPEILVEAPTAEVLVGFPNPVKESVSVILPDAENAPPLSDIIILDAVGRTYPVHASWSPDNSSLTLDLSSQQKGLYVIKILYADGVKILKVYKD